MKMLKTKTVSDQLGVNPTTIQRWAKHFDLYETNEHGHYLFTEKNVETMKFIQKELQRGRRMKDIDIHNQTEMKIEQKMIHPQLYETKMMEVFERVQALEKNVSQKADEVVSYQLLKHRNELEELKKLIQHMEARLAKLEIQPESEDKEELPMAAGEAPQRKWKTFMQLFSF